MSISAPYFIFTTELPVLISFIKNVLNNIFVPVLVQGVRGHGRGVGRVGLELILTVFFKSNHSVVLLFYDFYWDAVRWNTFIFWETQDGDGDKSVLKPPLLERLSHIEHILNI